MQCQCLTQSNAQCRNRAQAGSTRCHVHKNNCRPITGVQEIVPAPVPVSKPASKPTPIRKPTVTPNLPPDVIRKIALELPTIDDIENMCRVNEQYKAILCDDKRFYLDLFRQRLTKHEDVLQEFLESPKIKPEYMRDDLRLAENPPPDKLGWFANAGYEVAFNKLLSSVINKAVAIRQKGNSYETWRALMPVWDSLTLAARKGHSDIVDSILDNIISSFGEATLSGSVREAAEAAAKEGYVEIVERLLPYITDQENLFWVINAAIYRDWLERGTPLDPEIVKRRDQVAALVVPKIERSDRLERLIETAAEFDKVAVIEHLLPMLTEEEIVKIAKIAVQQNKKRTFDLLFPRIQRREDLNELLEVANDKFYQPDREFREAIEAKLKNRANSPSRR